MPDTRLNQISVSQTRSARIYLLGDGDLFSSIDFKYLQGQKGVSLVPCIISRFNGLVKLTYFAQGFVTLRSFAHGATPQQFGTVVVNVANAIRKVRANGLLSELKVDLASDALLVDSGSYDVHLIYLPLTRNVVASSPEEQLGYFCSELGELAQGNDRLSPVVRTAEQAASFDELCRLSDYGFSLATPPLSAARQPLYSSSTTPVVMGGRVPTAADGMSPASVTVSAQTEVPTYVSSSGARSASSGSALSSGLLLTGYVAGEPFEQWVGPGSHVIGRQTRVSDIVIYGMPTVGRRHCELVVGQSGAQVKDLQSTNGTFVNGVRLSPFEAAPLFPGDELGVSTLKLRVEEVAR